MLVRLSRPAILALRGVISEALKTTVAVKESTIHA
jgi:hypothetical protein